MTRVKMFTREGCGWCKKWHEEQERWVPPYWNLEKIQGGVASYPQFHISVDSKTRALIGFHTLPQIQKAIQELQHGSPDEN